MDKMPMTRESLILFGLLTGGDYDERVSDDTMFRCAADLDISTQKGLRGCGEKIALALARYGFGNALCSVARTLSAANFEGYLSEWRGEICGFLRTDPVQSMGSQHPALAAAMPDNFPDLEIIRLYLFPVTSSPDQIRAINPSRCLPDIVQITHLCELHFPWAAPTTILTKFETGAFRAMFVAALTDEVIGHEEVRKPISEVCGLLLPVFIWLTFELQLPSSFDMPSTSTLFPQVHFAISSRRKMLGIPHREVTGSTKHLQQLVLSSLRGLRKPTKYNQKLYGRKLKQPEATTPAGPFRMWVPESILLTLRTSDTDE
jgi:hypothetical protein